jgi:hypothetical protein
MNYMRGFTDLKTEAAALISQLSQDDIKGDMICSTVEECRS